MRTFAQPLSGEIQSYIQSYTPVYSWLYFTRRSRKGSGRGLCIPVWSRGVSILAHPQASAKSVILQFSSSSTRSVHSIRMVADFCDSIASFRQKVTVWCFVMFIFSTRILKFRGQLLPNFYVFRWYVGPIIAV